MPPLAGDTHHTTAGKALTSASHNSSHLARFGKPVAPLLPPTSTPLRPHSDPEKYTPLYGCYCAFGMSKGGLAPSDPLNFLLIDGKLHVFLKNEEMNTKTMWEEDAANPKQRAEAHWTDKTYK